MSSRKFLALFLFFLLFFSVNVFAEYKMQMNWATITTVANPNGPPNGPAEIGVNAYYAKGSTVAIADNPNSDWIEFEFELENRTTDDSGDPVSLIAFQIFFDVDGSSSYFNFDYSYDADPNPYTDSTGAIPYGGKIVFTIPAIEINYVPDYDSNKHKYILVRVNFGGGNPSQYVGQDLNTLPLTFPDYLLSNPGYVPPACPDGTCNGTETCATCPADCGVCPFCGDGSCNGSETCSSCPGDCGVCPPCGNGTCDAGAGETCSNCPVDCGICPELSKGLDVWLDPITCYHPVTGVEAPGANPYVHPNNPIRCDQVDSNTISYEVMMENVNSAHIGSKYVEVDIITMLCMNLYTSNRIMHYSDGCLSGCYRRGFWYENFPPSCEFLHYAGNQPMHSDCGISSATGFPEYSAPPLFTAIPDCTDVPNPRCPEQDKNVFYNTNYIYWHHKYPDPAEFTLQFGDTRIFKGTLTNAQTGGPFRCYARVQYSLYDAGTWIKTYYYQSMIFDGSNQGLYDGTSTSTMYLKILKLKGHDGFVVKDGRFMPRSPFIRPLVPWTVELPIKNIGDPWDGKDDSGNPSEKDILYVGINIIDSDWDELMHYAMLIDGSDAAHTLNTDEEKMFFVDIPVSEGLYHQFLDAVAMNAVLYDINGWIFDFTADTAIANIRLINVLNPIMYNRYGDECYTNNLLDKLCWRDYINYLITPIDLNANEGIEFILRLRNPFDFNEFFDLTYETNDPGNARLEFEPERNFIPPFTSGEFGYKYSKMILRNPKILRGDANYNILDTSVNYPYVWDNLDVQFRTYSNNLKVESFDLNVNKNYYSVGEELDFSLVIKNTGDRAVEDINFLVVSSMDPTVIFHAGNGIDIAAGATQEVTGTLPVIPFKGVFVVEAVVELIPFEYDFSDNNEKIFLVTGYEGDLSNLYETNYLVLIFIVLVVLFVVRKK